MSSPISTVTISQSLMRGLACAALNPGLQSILVFDAPYDALNAIASVFSQMLEVATGKVVERISLGISELDDDLWGSLAIYSDENGQSVGWHHGLLTAPADDPHLRLIVIPDLTKLSLAAARACVVLVGADVAHLERHGQQELWRPHLCWLASCARADVGSLSPHLLDRFSLRLHWQNTDLSNLARDTDWLQQVLKDTPYSEATNYPLPPEIKAQVQEATQYRATLTEEAIKYVLELIETSETSTMRRAIALARLASSLAQLENERQVKLAHVTTSAHLIGLPSTARQADGRLLGDHPPPVPTQELKDQSAIEQPLPAANPPSRDDAILPLPEVTEGIYESDQSSKQDEILISVYPYPEDKAPVEREVASLQLPLLRYSEARSGQGVVIGVERSDTPHDLAVVSTILAAAPFQSIRRDQLKQRHLRLVDQLKQTQSDQAVWQDVLMRQQRLIDQLERQSPSGDHDKHPFLISRSDLRRYRHSPTADLMLLVLLDYTSLRGCDWRESLLPYLIRAYVERASVCIVQVGMAGATHGLRAELVKARSILVPSIDAALVEAQGRATPLAHGLDLVLQTLRHAFQHGRGTIQQALLVVISDGRGNVPLEDSRAGRITQPVSRKGIEDALQVAQQLRDFRDVEKVLLNPQPKQYADLPLILAEVMGAEVKEIPRLDRAGV